MFLIDLRGLASLKDQRFVIYIDFAPFGPFWSLLTPFDPFFEILSTSGQLRDMNYMKH